MTRQLRLAARLAFKDVKLFLADRRAALLCFAVPIVLASAFGLIFERPEKQVNDDRMPVLIVDEDDSPASRALVSDFQQCPHVGARLSDRAAAERVTEQRSGGVAIVLPLGFGAASKPRIEMIHHPTATMEGQMAEGVLTELVMRRAAREFLEPLGLANRAGERPFTVERRSNAGASFSSLSHSFSGMTLQYLLFWGMDCGLLLLRERQRGIWRRLRSAPVPLTTILLGRALSTTLLALMQIAITFGFGWLVFGVKVEGSLFGFILLALSASMMAAGIGLLVASLGKTEASARSVSIVVILAAAMLGGLWLPAFLLPRWVQELSLVLPTTWAMRGFDAVTWQGRGLASIWPCLLAINLFAGSFLVLALLRFHWAEMRRRRGEMS